MGAWQRQLGRGDAGRQKLTIYFRKPSLREEGVLPRGGIARFYGTAKIYKSGPVYDEVWRRLVQPEKDRDPEKNGYAVLIAVERAEDLAGEAAEPGIDAPSAVLSPRVAAEIARRRQLSTVSSGTAP